MFFEARRDRPEVFELIEEAFDEIAQPVKNELKNGIFTRPGIGLMLPHAPCAASVSRNASLS